MKIAITGKGGVGKTTLTAALALLFEQEKRRVIAIDADPDTNLALALGLPAQDAARIVPLSEMRELVRERIGAAGGEGGGFVALNPRVDDIADEYGTKLDGISLLVLGAVRRGGAGCACPENVLLQALLEHLLVETDEVVIADMEAGIEHLGRGTARAVDILLIVAEPSAASLQTAETIRRLASDIGLARIGLVLNKVRDQDQADRLASGVRDIPLVGTLRWQDDVAEAAMDGRAVARTSVVEKVRPIKKRVEELLSS
ncbi:MAG: carbon monoxide dehydrogenase [Actinobacteria bacterium]|nr:MAG: carbon monoxide dehydrogenase [Actinomycetota bacterium]